MRFSIVTPTFDRRAIVTHAIDSALAFARAAGDCELLVVDDASRDGTPDMIRATYRQEIADGLLVLLQRPANGGATAAKNTGAQAARGDWLIFLDSDDRLLPAASRAIPAFVAAHQRAPVAFFRCEDEAGRLIGPPAPAGPLDFAGLLAHGTPGECLPVVSRAAFLAHPYDADLRGFEHLAYLRIVRASGEAMLSDAVVRRYATVGADRLSTIAGRLRRAGRMAQGFSRMLAEFGAALPPRQRAGLLLRVLCYRIAAIVGGAR